MLMIAAKNLLKAKEKYDLTPEGLGQLAYYQRYTGITLDMVVKLATCEDEVWRIGAGWTEAAGVSAYSSEVLTELNGEIDRREDEWWNGEYHP